MIVSVCKEHKHTHSMSSYPKTGDNHKLVSINYISVIKNFENILNFVDVLLSLHQFFQNRLVYQNIVHKA